MQTFLEETAQKLLHQNPSLEDCIIILPSKRAIGFLKKILSQLTPTTFFAPKMRSIEEFVEEISGLHILSASPLLIESYHVYSHLEEASFESYMSWAPTVLNDFNEIDRHLVPQKSFFDYLSSIKTLEQWGVQNQKSTLTDNYLRFWKSLHAFYESLQEDLMKKGLGYQGMVYRKATEDLEHYLASHGKYQHVFIGFNALNRAEEVIIQELLESGNASIYWDMDRSFAEDTSHSAGVFFRKHLQSWKYYQRHPKPIVSNHFESAKEVIQVAAPGDMDQVQYVRHLLERNSPEKNSQTAIVLADESLLIPLQYAIPKNVKKANVTMGLPLKVHPVVQFFYDWLEIQSKNRKTYYYKHIEKLLNHSLVACLIPNKADILHTIANKNWSYLSLEDILSCAQNTAHDILNMLFQVRGNIQNTIENGKEIISCFWQAPTTNPSEKNALKKMYGVFDHIADQQKTKPFLQTHTALFKFFKEIISRESLDFEGDAYDGLQIMGVLETRVLDFKHLIVLSANEGILPAGKSQSSFITYDLKKQFGIPSYSEKDAVFAYHFFRMIQRAETLHLVYNNASRGLNVGEKSRFLMQLNYRPPTLHQMSEITLSSKISTQERSLQTISKTPPVLNRLREIAENGFSPSALTSYIRNPMEFYQQRVLGLQEWEEVEETVAYNTLGTIVHETLEKLYEPCVGQKLSIEVLSEMDSLLISYLETQFEKHFKMGDFKKGKNLIVFETAKKYVASLIDWDKSTLRQGHTVEIIGLEDKLKVPLSVPNLDFPIFLKGTVDRLDYKNGCLRVIDYKTGKVLPNELVIYDWDALTEDYKYSKAFQVLAYAYMYGQEHPDVEKTAGVISFKNSSNGYMQFGLKESAGSRKKDHSINESVRSHFKDQLDRLILEICNPAMDFVEKEV